MIDLQNLDCNCNNCKHLVRDLDKSNKWKEFHRGYQRHLFDIKVTNLREKADAYRRKWELEKFEALHNEADKMRFQFEKKPLTLSYGICGDNDITFIPNTLQLTTQKCFINRK